MPATGGFPSPPGPTGRHQDAVPSSSRTSVGGLHLLWMSTYANHLDAIRQLREMGATRITVGDVTVEFSSATTAPLESFEDDGEPSADDQKRMWEQEQYFSSRG